MTTPKADPRPATPTEQLRRWVRERIEGEESVSMPDVVNAAHTHFTKKRGFVRAFAEEQLRRLLYVTVQEVIANSRLLVLGDNAVSRPELRKRANGLNAFVNWYEHSGGRHIRLLDMTREELVMAADEREQSIRRDTVIVATWRTVIGQLDVGQVVKTKFTAEAIESIYTSIANP